MQAATGHDIGLLAKDSSGGILEFHQFEKPQRSDRVIEEQVNVRILTCFASRSRAKQIKMLYPEPSKLSLVLFQLSDGARAFHNATIT